MTENGGRSSIKFWLAPSFPYNPAHLEVLSDFTNQALEGQLPNQEFSGLLVAPDFTERDGSGPEPVRLLDTTGRWRGLAGSLGGELLAGSLATSGLTGGLLSAGHLE